MPKSLKGVFKSVGRALAHRPETTTSVLGVEDRQVMDWEQSEAGLERIQPQTEQTVVSKPVTLRGAPIGLTAAADFLTSLGAGPQAAAHQQDQRRMAQLDALDRQAQAGMQQIQAMQMNQAMKAQELAAQASRYKIYYDQNSNAGVSIDVTKLSDPGYKPSTFKLNGDIEKDIGTVTGIVRGIVGEEALKTPGVQTAVSAALEAYKSSGDINELFSEVGKIGGEVAKRDWAAQVETRRDERQNKSLEAMDKRQLRTLAALAAKVDKKVSGAPLSSKDKVTVSSKLNNIELAKQQLAKVRQAFDKAKGSIGPLVGALPTPTGQAYDKAVDALRQTVIGLTRTPGIGSMSDFESRLAIAQIPERSAVQYESTVKEAIENVDMMLQSLDKGYRDIAEGVLPGTASGPKAGTVENGYRFKGGDPADSNNWEKVL